MDLTPIVGVALLLLMAYVFFYLPVGRVRQLLVVVIILIISYALLVTVAEMPTFGAEDVPARNYVAERYIEGTVRDTGAVNAITAVIMDYRAFDTLGEVTVLFVAIAAALATLRAH